MEGDTLLSTIMPQDNMAVNYYSNKITLASFLNKKDFFLSSLAR